MCNELYSPYRWSPFGRHTVKIIIIGSATANFIAFTMNPNWSQLNSLSSRLSPLTLSFIDNNNRFPFLVLQFFAAYVPCEAQYKDAVQLTLEQIDVIIRLTDKYSKELTICTSAKGKYSENFEKVRTSQVFEVISNNGSHKSRDWQLQFN